MFFRKTARPKAAKKKLAFEALEGRVMLAIPTANIVDITPDPRNIPVGDVSITFSEAVTGVDSGDFQLTRDGQPVSLATASVTGSGSSYVMNLSTFTQVAGTYALTLKAIGSGIANGSAEALAADASDAWAIDVTPPTADVVDVAPDPRNSAVGSVSINFTEPVTGVNIADFTLTRNGAAVTISGLTVNGVGANYSINLSSVTSIPGTYVLSLVAAGSGIADLATNAIAENAVDTFVVDTTVPTADIIDISPDPRTTAVGTVTITFSEAVTGVDIADFTLTRNGSSVPLAALTVNGSGANYTLDLSTVTGPLGSYVLTLVASGSNINDLSGNALAANASDSWQIDDANEQNDTLATARELGRLTGPITVSPLGLIDANDWFRFTTNKTGGATSSVSITFQNADGNLDLQLYNVSGQLLKSSIGNGNTEKISLSGRKAGTYFIRVYGKAGAINPSYSLSVNAPAALMQNTAAIDALMTGGSWAKGKRKT